MAAGSKLASFIDKDSSWAENSFMRSFITATALCLTAVIGGATMAQAASSLYWCPDQKADRQYSARQGPGCVPLAEKEEAKTSEQEGDVPVGNKPLQDFKVENLQSDVSTFLNKYRNFLDCCKTDLAELQQVEEMGKEVGELLTSTQSNMSNHSMASRGIMLREMIPTVAKARADLKKLRATLERISTSTNARDSGDFENSGREALAIREMEGSIETDIRAPKLSTGPKTGASIGNVPAAGPSIGKTPKTGNTIGAEGLTGQHIGASSKNSHDIGSSGPAGFGIGATGRAGPSIGESSLNSESSSAVGSSLQRSTVGSSLSDSTVGSSFGDSSVGSSLRESAVGSSFGSSSVGSTIQERSTGPQQ
ncbi:MAG: hypothetical protein CAF45_008645 [Nitrospira sp. CG24E]|nr:MAG: hypothetical protein CAF45_008645 [Nitrospira sp. CG24E]